MRKKPSTTIILTNGNFHTLDARNPYAQRLTIQGNQILAVGSIEDVDRLPDSNIDIIDLKGRTVLPSFSDSHIHLEKLALTAEKIDCATSSLEECINRVRLKAEQTPSGTWIIGHGWDQNLWGRFGNNDDLDAVSPDHPVYLTAKSLHAGWANSVALSIANINRTRRDPSDGKIDRDVDGEPTGILLEGAMALIANVIPTPSEEELACGIFTLQDKLLRLGITYVHDFDSSLCLRALQSLRDRGNLNLRVLKHVKEDDFPAFCEKGIRSWSGDEWISYGNLKLFADGALGPRTASMLDPYAGTDNYGMSLYDEQGLLAIAKQAADAGIAVAVHAIGDRAIRIVLDVLEKLREYEVKHNIPPLPHRIEHLQILHPRDISRPADLGVIVSMQPIHATSDMEMTDLHLVERARYAYAFRSQLLSGAHLIFGSDAPVESPNPFLGIHAAVTRRRVNGEPGSEGWIPEEKITVHEAIHAYTAAPAAAANMSSRIGKLLPGYFADLVILDADPYQCKPSDIHEISPVATMVAGEWRHRTF